MPFPRNWAEELVIEWLHLEDYLVESNFPVGAAGAGGRFEADVISARIIENRLEVVHVEVGQLGGGKKQINSIEKKFTKEISNTIENYFKKIFSFEGDEVNYQKVYFAYYCPKDAIEALKNIGVEVLIFPEFIKKVLQTINKWKKDKSYFKSKGGARTPPESMWLIRLIDYLKYYKMLNLGDEE